MLIGTQIQEHKVMRWVRMTRERDEGGRCVGVASGHATVVLNYVPVT